MPGGQARVLEFSEVQAEWFKPIYDFHSFKVLPKLGSLFAGRSADGSRSGAASAAASGSGFLGRVRAWLSGAHA